ncbi:thioesterase family protein [Actinoplanes sp. NPDC049265]|uniref:thioesterase family protein n=1 Tax=Actinoplanes sp. NPDC049265 TaxID=3363902 RepID=UPI00371B7973
MTAFYLPLGDDRYEPTDLTESPWDTRMQHGGPPAALLARAMAPDDQRLTRLSVDFLAPIPRRPLSVEVTTIKPGRLTALREARMVVDGKVAVVARGWHIAPGPEPSVVTPGEPQPPVPAGSDSGMDFFGYGRATDWHGLSGPLLSAEGHADVWTRVNHPLVAGEALTGVARTLIVADAANGLSTNFDLKEWLSIPPGMATTFLREPVGDWVRLACRTDVTADGIGLCTGDLSDPGGRFAQVTQPLLVRQR